jgi:hypothetical protein
MVFQGYMTKLAGVTSEKLDPKRGVKNLVEE